MISERHYQLLTAYVDGELGARQRKAVLRLLRKSSKARSLLRELQQDSRDLRDLTRFKLPCDFAQRVVDILEVKGPTYPAAASLTRTRAIPAWLGYAAAALLLVSAGALAFVLFSKGMVAHRSHNIAENNDDSSSSISKSDSSDSSQHAKASTSDSSAEDPSSSAVVIDLKEELKKLPADPPISEDKMSKDFGRATTDQKMEVSAPKLADAIHPTIKDVRGLKAADILPTIKKEHAVRLDFACKDSTPGCQRLMGVLKASGIKLITEQVADYRLKHPKLNTNYVVFLEDVTAEELAHLLEALGQEDQRAETSKSGEGQFNGLVLSRMTDADGKELKDLFGSYGKLLHLHLSAGSGSFDPKKSISSNTPDEVIHAPPRPDSSKSSVKTAERLGLVLPYNPVRPQSRSAEVRNYIEMRKQPRPDALQILLVLHEPRAS